MIYTVIADISEFDAEKFLATCECEEEYGEIKKGAVAPLPSSNYSAPKLRKEIFEHINSVSNERLKKERCSAYLLLSLVVREFLGFMPQVKFTQSGKPYIDSGSGLYFNLSHTTDLVALSISDEGSVGVDAEGEIAPERASRLEARFFSELSISSRPLDVKYAFCKISEDGRFSLFTEKEESPTVSKLGGATLSRVNQGASFAARWTLYEASLKCNGGGFTSLPCLGMIILETKVDTVQIKIGCTEFFVTTSSV